MKVNVEQVIGRKNVKIAMLASMGISPLVDIEEYSKKIKSKLSSNRLVKLLIAKHSVIEEMKFKIDLYVPERVHTHLVRHKEIGIYVATSRPDLKHKTELIDGMRFMTLFVNAKRLIEISEQRLCYKSWKETRDVWNEVVRQVIEIEPAFMYVLKKPCSKVGYCIETDRTCGHNFNEEYILHKRDIENLLKNK